MVYVMRGFVTVTVRHRHRYRDVTRLDQTVDTTPNIHIPHNVHKAGGKSGILSCGLHLEGYA